MGENDRLVGMITDRAIVVRGLAGDHGYPVRAPQPERAEYAALSTGSIFL